MRVLRNIALLIIVFTSIATKANSAVAWANDMRELYLKNQAIIYAINIRTFNAQDNDSDGIIEEESGEERGSFINAVSRLNEIALTGVNTILLLPVTPTGKIKALGTAGSLFAATEFGEINPQLKSDNDNGMTVEDEMRYFVDECHKRNLRVIVDLPCCGAYDLYLKHPELFKLDNNQKPITPTDWTDVRLLDAGTNEKINTDVYNLYMNFIDLMINLDVDGIRADVAGLKPYTFWKKMIDETRSRNPQFLFLAESSPNGKAPCENIEFTPYDKLLEAGFDGYYGTYSEIKNWQNSKDLFSAVKEDINISKKYVGTKKVLGNFATHDQISPVLINGAQMSKMIMWLNSTLPLNAYYIDGFPTGDNYIYYWANKKAQKSFTDDEYYFTHRGQLDIFNFSRRPVGKDSDLLIEFRMANGFRYMAKNIITNGNFIPLKCSAENVFAYARNYEKQTFIVIGNLDFKKMQKASISIPKLNKDTISIPIKITTPPVIGKGKINVELAPGEVQVLYLEPFELK